MKFSQLALFSFIVIGTMANSIAGAQTIAAPTIKCVTTDEQNGDVTITWINPPPESCGTFVGYVLFAATSSTGPFFILDTFTNQSQTTFEHTGANGTILDWFYFLVATYNCPGFVSDSSAIVQEEPLITPDLDFVTVLPGGGVRIDWFPTPSTQAEGYIIYYDLGGGTAVKIDTVFGRTSTTFIDTGANPNSGSIAYTIAAFDGCNNKTLNSNKPHNTIYLTATSQQCAQQVYLEWNLYINWPSVSEYLVETSVDNGPYTQAASFQSPNYYFPLAGIVGDSICFRIEAVHQNGTTVSISNETCLKFDLIRSTKYNELRRVSVNASGTINVEWYIDSTADINSLFINRSLDGNGYSIIDSQVITTPVFFNSYNDTAVNPSQSSYYYRITSRDNCDSTVNSGEGRTIFLTGANNTSVNTLKWSSFELDHATVLDYTIYREDNGSLVPVQNVSGSTFTYDDPVANGISDLNTFCYVVEANYRLSLPGFQDEMLQSTSNLVCVDLPPVIYVPNAFVPDGKNNVFKPTLLNPNVAEYEFKIFDRWGKMLFETELVSAGWDGSNNGEKMPLGGYAYYIKAVSFSGAAEERKGIVVLVR